MDEQKKWTDYYYRIIKGQDPKVLYKRLQQGYGMEHPERVKNTGISPQRISRRTGRTVGSMPGATAWAGTDITPTETGWEKTGMTG